MPLSAAALPISAYDRAVLRRSASIDDGVALRCEPGKDFTGGEFVMTEQRPRMQPRPMVLSLRKGDMAIITVALRPHQGAKGGYYRVNLKHAISRVRSGERIGLELLLHDTRQA